MESCHGCGKQLKAGTATKVFMNNYKIYLYCSLCNKS